MPRDVKSKDMPRGAIGAVSSLPLAIVLAFGATACLANDVVISPSQVQQLEIGLTRVKTATSEAVAVLPGTVVPASNARITAAAPFAGTVLKVDALPGQIVR